MPETSVDEHRHPLPLEDKVWSHDQVSLPNARGDPRPELKLDRNVPPPTRDSSLAEG